MYNGLKLSEQDNLNLLPYNHYDIYYEPVDNKENYNEPSYAIKKPISNKTRFSRNNIDNNSRKPKQKLFKYLSHETYLTDKVKECLDINIIMYLKKHKVLRIDKLKVNIYDLKKYEKIPIYELLHIMENQCRDIEYFLGSSVQEILNDLNRIDESEIMNEMNVAKVNISTELEGQVDHESTIFYSLAQDLDNNYNVFITDAPIAINIHKSEARSSSEDFQNISTFSNYDHVTESLKSISNEEERRTVYIQGDSVQVQTVTQNYPEMTTQSEEVTNTIFEVLNTNEHLEFERKAVDSIDKSEHNVAVTNDVQRSYELNQIINTDSTTSTVIRDNSVYPEIVTTEMFVNNGVNDILNTEQAKRVLVSTNSTHYSEIYGQYINAVNNDNETKHNTTLIITDNSETVTQRISKSINVEMTTRAAVFTENYANPFLDHTSHSLLNTDQTTTSTFITDTTYYSENITQTHYEDNAFQNIGDMDKVTENNIFNSTPLYVDFTGTHYEFITAPTNLDENNKTHTNPDIVKLNDIELVTATSVDDFAQPKVSKSIVYDSSNNLSTQDYTIEYLTSSEKSITLEEGTLENSGVTQVEMVDTKNYYNTETSTETTVEELIRYSSNFTNDLETTSNSYLLTIIDKSNDNVETNQTKNSNKNDDYITIIAKETEITGQLYFHHKDVQIPLYFKQSLDGKVNLNINGTELCDKLIQKMSKSLLIKVLCEQ